MIWLLQLLKAHDSATHQYFACRTRWQMGIFCWSRCRCRCRCRDERRAETVILPQAVVALLPVFDMQLVVLLLINILKASVLRTLTQSRFPDITKNVITSIGSLFRPLAQKPHVKERKKILQKTKDRESVTRFSTLFYIKKTPPGPHMIRQRWLHKIFCFNEDIHEKHMSTKSSTTRTRTRLHRHFQKTMKASHRFKKNNQGKKGTNSNNLTIWRHLYPK